jgi:hypothetical protein
MCSPSFCLGRSPGTVPAITASAESSVARGPRRLGHYQFVARGIAEALAAVGAGDTYMRASRVARDRARRFRFDPGTGEVRESAHGQLVADWVELFAPVLFEARRARSWPAEGSLLLDHLPFRIRAEDASGRGIPGGTVAFDVFCAVGYRASKPRLWHAEAFSTAHPANWSVFLGSLEGEPSRVVCDAHRAMLHAIGERGPTPSCTNANGICSTRLSGFLPRSCARTRASSWRSCVSAPRGRSPAPASGCRSSRWHERSRTRASTAG